MPEPVVLKTASVRWPGCDTAIAARVETGPIDWGPGTRIMIIASAWASATTRGMVMVAGRE
jgi:hypothetical protein